jgi:hypothetical protein
MTTSPIAPVPLLASYTGALTSVSERTGFMRARGVVTVVVTRL